MTDITALRDFINKQLEERGLFLVELTAGDNGLIDIVIDSDTTVDVDTCAAINREVRDFLGDAADDCEILVGSAGLTAPLRLPRQYAKFLGKEVETLAADGKKYRGTLIDVTEAGFSIESEEKVKREGQKRPTLESVRHDFDYDKVKYTKYILQF